MRYRFVGSQDVPEWILAEVSVLSKIVSRCRVDLSELYGRRLLPFQPSASIFSPVQSCVRLKLISRQVVLDLCGSSPLDFEKLARLVPKDSGERRGGLRIARGKSRLQHGLVNLSSVIPSFTLQASPAATLRPP